MVRYNGSGVGQVCSVNNLAYVLLPRVSARSICARKRLKLRALAYRRGTP